jgi:hypothetical protein
MPRRRRSDSGGKRAKVVKPAEPKPERQRRAEIDLEADAKNLISELARLKSWMPSLTQISSDPRPVEPEPEEDDAKTEQPGPSKSDI